MQEPSEFRGPPAELRPAESPDQPTGAATPGESPEKPAEIVVRATSVEIRPESAAPGAPHEPAPAPQPARPQVVPPSSGKTEDFANRPGAPSGSSSGATSNSGSGSGAPPPEPRSLDPHGEPRRSSGWAVACHLLGLVDFGVSVLFLGLIATLCAWLIAKDKDAEADFHGKEALNFQLNILFWQVMAVPLCCCLVGGPLLVVLPFVKLFLMVVAAIKAANGERWRYPLVVRVLR